MMLRGRNYAEVPFGFHGRMDKRRQKKLEKIDRYLQFLIIGLIGLIGLGSGVLLASLVLVPGM